MDTSAIAHRPPLRWAIIGVLLLMPVAAAGQHRSRLLVGPVLGSYTIRADAVNGTAAAAGAVIVVSLKPWLDLEGDIQRPAEAFRRQYTGTTLSFAGPGASFEEIERLSVFTRTTNERRVDAGLSVGVAFHPAPASRRLQPRLSLGTTTHLVSDRTWREPVRWPAAVSLDQILRMQPLEESDRRGLGSLTLGAGLAIELTRHVVIAPDFRYDYGSMGDEINDTARASVRLLFRF